MKLTPLGDRVIVDPEVIADKTSGGIFIPEKSKEKPQKGTIMAIGYMSSNVQPGDVVLYGKHSGIEITFEGKKYLILRSGDCFAIVN